MLPINIALVDDEQAFHTLFKMGFKKRLKNNEIEIFNFEAAQPFLEFLEGNTHKIEIIILISDINMPGMNGLDLCHIIKERYPEIEVYMASAYGNDDYKLKAKQAGAKDFFTKPIDFNEVDQLIQEKIDIAS